MIAVCAVEYLNCFRVKTLECLLNQIAEVESIFLTYKTEFSKGLYFHFISFGGRIILHINVSREGYCKYY